MKNNDIHTIQKIIEYCDIEIFSWMNMKEITSYFNHQNHFNYLQVCV